MNASVLKGVIQLPAEYFKVRFTTVERGIVFAREVTHRHVKAARHVLKFAQALATHFGVVRGLRQITGKHHKIRLLLHPVDGGERFGQSAARVGIHFRIAIAPVDVSQLHETEIRATRADARATRQSRGKHQPAYASHCQKIPSAIVFVVHVALQVNASKNTVSHEDLGHGRFIPLNENCKFAE